MLLHYLTAFCCFLLKWLDLEGQMSLDKVAKCCLYVVVSTEMLPLSYDFLCMLWIKKG